MAPDNTPALSEARLQAVLKLVPAIQLFSLIDAVLLSWYFWQEVSNLFLISWSVAMAVHGAVWLLFAWRKPLPAQGPRPHRWRWMLVHAATEALLFSVFIVVVFPLAPSDKAVVLGALVTGLLAAGALSKMSIPSAAVVFIALLSAGSSMGFLLSPLPSPWVAESLLAAFALALATLVLGMSKVFDARVNAETELVRQKTLVSDLLEDFGESTSEGLWETDSAGRLTLVTPRLAALFGVSADALDGQPLMHGWESLVKKGTAFRNFEVPVDSSGGRWWSLTGKPLKQGDSIVGWRGVASDVTEQRQRELEILRVSRYDNLTGLLNRRSFRSLLDGHFAEPTPGLRCLALIDIVDFKDVNESRGHAFGDALLVAVADRLKAVLPDRLVVARLDGDEFALQGLVPVSISDSLQNLARLLKALVEPYSVLGDRFEAGFRFGVAFTPDATTAELWLRCADLALRSAKTEGRNRIRTYSPDLMESFVERNLLRSDLRGALQRGEFFLEYQPIVDLGRGRMVGVEALARWRHPSRGLISPAVFIPLAEETELILELGLWVLEEACRAAAAWPEVALSVNVSGVQLRSDVLAERVSTLLAELKFPAERLVLEVTESALIKNDTSLEATFSTLKKMGIHWALDDFGTGYSSLSYLQDFPFDLMKIDQSFVRSLSRRTGPPALLGSIVALARTIGLSTTAEGIEEPTHQEILKELGCAKGQGYLFSQPVAADRIPELLNRTF